MPIPPVQPDPAASQGVAEDSQGVSEGPAAPPVPEPTEQQVFGDQEELQEVTVEPSPVAVPPTPTEQAPPAPIAVSFVQPEAAPVLEEAEPAPLRDPVEEYRDLLAAMDPSEPLYVQGTRAPMLKVGRYRLSPGDVVPGAHAWPRRDAWERTGQLVRA